jgi:hypothetical protein
MSQSDPPGPHVQVLPSGRPVATGRIRPSLYDDPRTHNVFRLARYVDRSLLGDPPDVVDNTEYLQPIMGANDRLGDCVVVGEANYSILASNMAGQSCQIGDQDCVRRYSQLGGYDPATGANDNGLVEVDALDDWRHDPFAGVALLGYASIDVHDDFLLRHAIRLFAALYVGLALPTTAQAQEGQDWDVVPGTVAGSWGGHCVIVPRYDWRGSTKRWWDATWAYYQPMTQSFWRTCGDEAYAPLPTVWLDHPRPGVNVDLLKSDLAALGRVR